MEPPAPDSFFLDDEPLRAAILKGYFGDRVAPLEPEPLMAILRDLLSGPPGCDSEPESFSFEIDPDSSVPAFLLALDGQVPGLAALIAEPLLAAGEDLASGRRKETGPSLSALISSLAGPIAARSGIKESDAEALLAGFLIAVERLGPRRARALYRAARPHPGA